MECVDGVMKLCEEDQVLGGLGTESEVEEADVDSDCGRVLGTLVRWTRPERNKRHSRPHMSQPR